MENELEEELEKLMDSFLRIKEIIRRKNKFLFEQWKAGGFLVDDDIMCMYPNVQKCVESILEDENKETENATESGDGPEYS